VHLLVSEQYIDSIMHVATIKDVTLWFINLYPICCTCFGRCFRPSSGAFDCIYSFWYSPPMLLPAGVMYEMESCLLKLGV